MPLTKTESLFKTIEDLAVKAQHPLNSQFTPEYADQIISYAEEIREAAIGAKKAFETQTK